MGRFVVRGLASQPEAIAGDYTGASKTALGGLSNAIDWIWSALASEWMLKALSALLLLWCITVVAIPGSWPGLVAGSVSVAGRATYAMDLLHPVAGWSLRALFAAMMVALVIRTSRDVVPSMDGLVPDREPVPLAISSLAAANDPATVWEQVLVAIAPQLQASRDTVSLNGRQELLAYPTLGRRLASQLRNAGLTLLIASALVMGAEARTIVSPTLLLGIETLLPAVAETEPQVVTLQALEAGDGAGKPRAIVLWPEPGESTPSAMTVIDVRWRQHRGFWVRIADIVPAVWLRALGPDGSPLMLHPVVGDRQGITEYRAVLDGKEEQVLAVPEARSVLRISLVTEDTGRDQVVIEVLDGGLGTVIDRMRLSGDTTLRVDGMTVEARMEHAGVLTLWQLPGLTLFVLGAIGAVVGVFLRRAFSPWKAWMGLSQIGQSGEWQLLLATDPGSLADTLESRLRPQSE